MIISKKIESLNEIIEQILNKTATYLEEECIKSSDLSKISGVAFEKVVCDGLNKISIGTKFQDTFEQTSKNAFPDLISKILEKNWYGIEVKTSQKDWKSFGNSIFEKTRIDHLDDRIYLFFGRFQPDFECKWAKYEECIDKINITHSPRYQINMEILEKNELTVFHKMGTSYKYFRDSTAAERMEMLRKYKKREVGQNIALWWLPNSDEVSDDQDSKLLIKLYSDLSINERKMIKVQILVLFPEVFSNNPKKYNKVLTWLASHHGVVSKNLRDIFTAGGKWEYIFNDGKTITKIPRIYKHISENKNEISTYLNAASSEDLQDFWCFDDENVKVDFQQKLETWIKLVDYFSEIKDSSFEPRELLDSLFFEKKME